MNERTPYGCCPLCGHQETKQSITADCSHHPLYRESLKPTIDWRQCTKCLHIFTEGYYSGASLDLILANTNEDQQLGHNIEQLRHISARIIEKILPYTREGYWLDVGFGNGSLLFTAQEFGFTPIGVDIRRENAEKLASLNIRSYCEDFKKLNIAEKCSVVSMADVLEHMPFPKDALRNAHRLLKDTGILFISMPNTESMVWKAMDQNKENPYWSEIEHYHNFSRTRIYSLLEEHGFAVLRYGISERYRAGMEIVAAKRSVVFAKPVAYR